MCMATSSHPIVGFNVSWFVIVKTKLAKNSWPNLSEPQFEASVRMRLALPKVGTWSPLKLPQFQSSIAEVKTHCLEVFFIPLERPWSLDVENGLAWAIRTSTTQVMVERRAGSQIGNLTPDHRSRCVQVECDTPLESSWGELQVFFRPRPNQRFEPGIMSSQSPGSPIRDNFGTPPWESQD
jgi:hypothetical protein